MRLTQVVICVTGIQFLLRDYASATQLDFDSDSATDLYTDVDMLIPAAFENQITSETASNIKALNEMGVSVVLNILANAGGITVSYFEWIQNL